MEKLYKFLVSLVGFIVLSFVKVLLQHKFGSLPGSILSIVVALTTGATLQIKYSETYKDLGYIVSSIFICITVWQILQEVLDKETYLILTATVFVASMGWYIMSHEKHHQS